MLHTIHKMEHIYKIGAKWTDEEDKALIQEYKEGKNIVEISQLHDRLPNGIATRLLGLYIITDKNNARGYIGYKESEYYKKYLESEKRKSYIENNVYSQKGISNEIITIRKELKEMKQHILELTEMIKSIYEFENS